MRRLSAAVCLVPCDGWQSAVAMELLGQPVAIAGRNGEKLGDVIDFRLDPLQFIIIYHDNIQLRGWRVGESGTSAIGSRSRSYLSLVVIVLSRCRVTKSRAYCKM